MKDTILAIAGRPGLYRLLARGRGNLIVESLDAEKKRFPAGSRDRVTSLNDVSMYTAEADVALMQVFQNIYDKHHGAAPLNHKNAEPEDLTAFMADVLPDYDRDRVHLSDIRKLVQWYNTLIAAGYTQFVDEESESQAADAAPAEEEKD